MAQDSSSTAALKNAGELQRTGKYAAAIEVYRSFLQSHPDADANVRIQLGLAYYRSGDYRHAAEHFEMARSPGAVDSDSSASRLVLLGDCYMRLGEYKKAIAVLDPVVDARPDDLRAAYLMGTALLHESEEERGLHILEAIMSRADTPEARLLLATRKLRAVDLHGALTDVQRCMELDPLLAECHVLHGRILLLGGDPAGGEAAFRRALAVDPGSFDALLQLGAIARKQGRAAEARELVNRALAIRSGDVPARFQLALIESEDHHDSRAAELLEGVVKDDPGLMEAHVRLAIMYFRLNRPEEGRREKEIAARLETERQQRGRERPQQAQ